MSKHTLYPWENELYTNRFWSRVDVKGDDECWEWSRGATTDGYGVFHFGHESIRAHRFSYQQRHGAIRSHDCVCHTCDNPRCVNPSHLWLGTRAENNADKEAKGRAVHPNQKHGEGNSYATISTPEVMAIRVMARSGMPQARIASFLGVSPATVCMIASGERRTEETERRVSACVNACAGFEVKTLESIAMTGETLLARFKLMKSENEQLEQQQNELLAALSAASEKMKAAHESMFEQCLSNSAYNAWGKEISLSAINELQLAASRIDSAIAKTKGCAS